MELKVTAVEGNGDSRVMVALPLTDIALAAVKRLVVGALALAAADESVMDASVGVSQDEGAILVIQGAEVLPEATGAYVRAWVAAQRRAEVG